MQFCATKLTISLNNFNKNVIELSDSEDEKDNNSQKQLVLYNLSVNNVGPGLIPGPGPMSDQQPLPQRVLPSIGVFTAQCAKCFKWRLIPTQEKYEEIREKITEMPFVCERAREWHVGVSCNDPADIEQDGSRIWAIDKPDIAQPPPGWHRDLRIRGEGSTKFADIYYTSPMGKTLRSIPDVEKYLLNNPEFIEQGVTTAQFSFQIPKPLQENYVRKRDARVSDFQPNPAMQMLLRGPQPDPYLQVGMPGFYAPYPFPKKARSARAPAKRRHNFGYMMFNHHN